MTCDRTQMSLFIFYYEMIFLVFFLFLKHFYSTSPNNNKANQNTQITTKQIKNNFSIKKELNSQVSNFPIKNELEDDSDNSSDSQEYEEIEPPLSIPLSILTISYTTSFLNEPDPNENKDGLIMILIGALAGLSIIIIIVLIISIIHVKKRSLGIPELESDLL